MEERPNFPLLLGLLLLAGSSIALAWFGWWHHVPTSDAAYLALKSVEGGDAYEGVGEHLSGNLSLEAARFLGLFVEPVAFLVLFVSLSRQSLLRFSASIKRGHIVVVGDSPFADKLSESREAPIVHLRGIDDNVHRKGALIRLPFGGFNARDLHAGGAGKAARIVVACAEDAQSINLATAAHDLFRNAHVSVRVNDVWLADQIHNTTGAEKLHAFSESCLAARYVMRCWPPFLLSRDAGQTRLHALLIGGYDAMEAMMSEMILSAKTLHFGRMIFSFVCDQPDLFQARLAHRYPEIAELHFHPAESLDGDEVFAVNLSVVQTPAPVTAVYCLQSEGARAMATALSLVQQGRDSSGFEAPIFVLRGAQGLRRPAPGQPLPPFQIVPFGGTDDLVMASGVLSLNMDGAERAFHEAYLKGVTTPSEAVTEWDNLKEEYRLSNRRAVAHIPAKLFEAGVDIRSWMAGNDLWASLPKLPAGTTLFKDDETRERLARLEHERWMADRRLSGWRFGAERDNVRKLHPDIRPFEDLTPVVQDYDRHQVDVVGEILRES
jgi:hypothetical protein